jgi:hypothetical protein
VALLWGAACATFAPPPPGALERAAASSSWSGSLRVTVKGESLRGRSRALVAFRRPDGLRIEIPGPAGARLVAVARGGRLTAVLPGERAYLETSATPDDLEALVGIPLAPSALMDLVLGVAPPGARAYRASWGETLPRRVEATLADGTRVALSVDEAEAGLELPGAAFDPPPHGSFRRIDADEARRLLGGRS